MPTYANGLSVTETPLEQQCRTGLPEVQEAFRAGAGAQARHAQEEVPEELRAMVNRVRALATRPGAQFRTPESILIQALAEFRSHYLEVWSA